MGDLKFEPNYIRVSPGGEFYKRPTATTTTPTGFDFPVMKAGLFIPLGQSLAKVYTYICKSKIKIEIFLLKSQWHLIENQHENWIANPEFYLARSGSDDRPSPCRYRQNR